MDVRVWMNFDPGKVDLSYLLQRFRELGYGVDAEAVPAGHAEAVLEKARKADVVIAAMEEWNEKMLSAVAGKVRLIQKYGTGLDTIDLEAAGRHGIAVANIPGANAAAVAEVALLHILNVGRKFVPCVCGVKNGRWDSTVTGTELDGKTVGLLGYGRIAKNLARMLGGFRVDILAYDPFVQSIPAQDGVTPVQSAEELFKRSDIVSLHIPSTEETKGSVGRNLFSLMKKGAYLVNTCRGDVVNEADLADALQSGQIAAAGLDVLAVEPPDAGHALLAMDNVFISSHMGAESYESAYRSQVIMGDNVERFLRGEPGANIKNREFFVKENKEQYRY